MWLAAVHTYEPASFIVVWLKVNVLAIDITVLFPAFLHEMLGLGKPLALQNRTTVLPFRNNCFRGAITIEGVVKTIKRTANIISRSEVAYYAF